MTDDEFLEKVCDFSDRWSKPLLAGIGGYMLSVVVIALNVTDWVVASARDNPGALIAFGVGGALTGAVLASLFWRHVMRKALKAKDSAAKKRITSELAGTGGFEQVDSLDSLVEKARELSSLQNKNARLMEDNLSLQKQLAQANDYWKSQIARAQADVSAKNAELEREKSLHERERAAKEAEIAELESKLRHPVPVSMDALFAQPWQVRRAVLDAADKGWTDLPLGKAPSAVLSSMLSVEGIFRRRATLFSDMKSERETYYVTPEWKLLLMEDGNVEKLRVTVNG